MSIYMIYIRKNIEIIKQRCSDPLLTDSRDSQTFGCASRDSEPPSESTN